MTTPTPTSDTTNSVSTNSDVWSRQASTYASMMLTGPMMTLITRMYTHMATLRPFSTATTVLDVGCGPGSATLALINDHAESLAPTTRIVASDFSAGMVAQVRALRERKLAELDDANADGVAGQARQLWQQLEAEVWNAQDLSAVPDASVSHYIASLVLFMLPDASLGLGEAHRVLEPGGVMSCSSWKHVSWMDLAMEARGKRASDFKLPQKWAEAESVRTLLEEAGFEDVVVEEVRTYMNVENAELTAAWFFGRETPMAALIQGMEEEERVQAMANLEKLFRKRKDPETGGVPGEGIVATGRKRGD